MECLFKNITFILHTRSGDTIFSSFDCVNKKKCTTRRTEFGDPIMIFLDSERSEECIGF